MSSLCSYSIVWWTAIQTNWPGEVGSAYSVLVSWPRPQRDEQCFPSKVRNLNLSYWILIIVFWMYMYVFISLVHKFYRSESPLALLYSTSTMEHHHLDHCVMILNSEVSFSSQFHSDNFVLCTWRYIYNRVTKSSMDSPTSSMLMSLEF